MFYIRKWYFKKKKQPKKTQTPQKQKKKDNKRTKCPFKETLPLNLRKVRQMKMSPWLFYYFFCIEDSIRNIILKLKRLY